jgi:AraC family transcriptional regulator, regulatory protein of adaptative response / methylated-DNA-[protein]-cysteine methyltransferase
MAYPLLTATRNSVLNRPMTDTPTDPLSDEPLNSQAMTDYQRIETTIRYLTENQFDQPELRQVAAEVGLSEFHFQRLFSRWAGISPKKFLQYLTLTHAKQSLAASASVLDATLDAGLSGPGRLHDLFLNLQQVTPGEYKARGLGLEFRYAFHPSPFGECLAVENDRGLAGLSFVVDGNRELAVREQQQGWDQACWIARPDAGSKALAAIFPASGSTTDAGPVSLLMRGTPYQVRVWEALLKIPVGCTTTYGHLADRIGFGKTAARAVGNACGANRIGVLIPCHRVIRDTGVVSGYRWGIARKKALLAFEAAKARHPDSAVL